MTSFSKSTMFSHKLKNFFIKNNVKKRLSNVKHATSSEPVQSIGIIIDDRFLNELSGLIDEIKNFGFNGTQIEYVVFKERIKKDETFDYSVFSYKDINWNGRFLPSKVADFCLKRFDLLISYYTDEKAALLLATHCSKASFKVGFSEVDNRLHHFMIKEDPKHYSVFVEELFKYLKILKKI